MSHLCIFCTLPILDATDHPGWHDRCFNKWQDELKVHGGSCDKRRFMYAAFRDDHSFFAVLNVLKNWHNEVWGYPIQRLDPTTGCGRRGEVPDHFLDKIETDLSVLARLQDLSANEAQVIYFLYMARPMMTIKEIHEKLDISERQVYRLRTKAIKRMSTVWERLHLEAITGATAEILPSRLRGEALPRPSNPVL
jgi:hypothetical protein